MATLKGAKETEQTAWARAVAGRRADGSLGLLQCVCCTHIQNMHEPCVHCWRLCLCKPKARSVTNTYINNSSKMEATAVK